MVERLKDVSQSMRVFFADGRAAGRLGVISDVGFELLRDGGPAIVLILEAFGRVEPSGVILVCDERSVDLFRRTDEALQAG